MQVLGEVRSPDVPASADQRVTFYGVGWDVYEALLLARGESSVPRLTYVDGTLEVTSRSFHHARIKANVARLLEAWALRERLDLNGYGSWTVHRADRKRGIEADECYILGPERKDRPDLAIEVVWTPGGVDRLDVYRGLEVPEVWLWKDGRIHVYVLDGAGYAEVERSRLLPATDLAALARFSRVESQLEAVQGFLSETA